MKDGELEKRVVVVTGAAGFLGSFFCRALLEAGALVLGLDSDPCAIRMLDEGLSVRYSGRLVLRVCDVTDQDSLDDVAEQSLTQWGPASGLVNAADVNPKVDEHHAAFAGLQDLSLEDWNRGIAVGLTGTMLACRVFGSQMTESGRGGSIVVVSSMFGLIAPDQRVYRSLASSSNRSVEKPATYTVVKHGQIGLVKHLAAAWGAFGIRVNALCPGAVLNETEMVMDVAREISLSTPLQRLGDPHEIANAATFLVSDQSSYMTGASLVVDGGRTSW